jgi:hypothetical protein
MADFFAAVVLGICDFIRLLAETIVGWGEDAWQWFKGVLSSLFAEVWEALLGLVPSGVWEWLGVGSEGVAASLWSAVVTPNGETWIEVVGDLAWIFPLGPCFLMVVGVYQISGIIRLARWVKSCIPTVSGA